MTPELLIAALIAADLCLTLARIGIHSILNSRSQRRLIKCSQAEDYLDL